jgi:lipopolysaccharide/colanic/teichoic acid biosynthesis glycosyltransferase
MSSIASTAAYALPEIAWEEPEEKQVAHYFRLRGWLGRTAAGLLLVLSAPLVAALCLLVRLTSRGPAIYAQQRAGQHGRVFWLYKIRTMRVDAEAASGPVWTQRNDSRITWLGLALRKLHLDEFPQLWNVVRGDMALVGPRPERPEFIQVLAPRIPGYLDRLAVRPGITGLAQINLPADTDLDSVRRKLVLDLEYIRRGSASLDVRIFLCTLLRLLGLRGELTRRRLGLHRRPTIASQPGGDVTVQAAVSAETRRSAASSPSLAETVRDEAGAPRAAETAPAQLSASPRS